MIAIGNQTVEAMYERESSLGIEKAKADQFKLREAGYTMLWNSVVGIIKTGLLPNEDSATGQAILSNVGRNSIETSEISNDFDGSTGEVSLLHAGSDIKGDADKKKRIALAEQDVERLEALI
ncbi:amp deaminase [Lasius niger]|uniref:Amp deaminase n=1 Tax=Lasius niger TaxID=67767 RepID=A0A0J7KIJ8_LASNI|nr:amp deaminase [Lasius niger]